MRQKYVITAGINKAGRQMYICSYDDEPNYWCLSAVPYITSKTRCYELIAQIKRDIKNQTNKSMIHTVKTEIPLEIVEWPIT